jgi:hypothetical protein
MVVKPIISAVRKLRMEGHELRPPWANSVTVSKQINKNNNKTP